MGGTTYYFLPFSLFPPWVNLFGLCQLRCQSSVLWKGMLWSGFHSFARVFCRPFWAHTDPIPYSLCRADTMQNMPGPTCKHGQVSKPFSHKTLHHRAAVRGKVALETGTCFLPTGLSILRMYQLQGQRTWVDSSSWFVSTELRLYYIKHSFCKPGVWNMAGFIKGSCFFLRLPPHAQLLCGHPSAWPHGVKICGSYTSHTDKRVLRLATITGTLPWNFNSVVWLQRWSLPPLICRTVWTTCSWI